MAFQTVFKRYELKYMLTKDQKEKVLNGITPYMHLDEYGRTTIRNIYYDTDNYELVRKSIESPIYKEKLRIRSYSQADSDKTVFVELKKKYESVVYKRRLALKEHEAMDWVDRRRQCPVDTQISREVDYFIDHYETLHPVAFLSYEREAFYTKEKSDFRVTFDDTILFRDYDLSLKSPVGGIEIIPEDATLMEIKCSGAIPLWMVSILSENKINKTSFSKYGTAYKSIIYPKIIKNFKENNKYVRESV